MKAILTLLIILAGLASAQEWNGDTFPTLNDRDTDSLRKLNRIFEDSKTATHDLNVLTILTPIAAVVQPSEYNGATWPSVSDTQSVIILRKINKILNDARTGAAPLTVQLTGTGGAITLGSGQAQITITPSTKIISIGDVDAEGNSTSLQVNDATGRITANGTLISQGITVFPSLSGGAVTNSSTITMGGYSTKRVTAAAAVTGVILQSGTIDGQKVTIINESAAVNTITMAASGTSHVADGVGTVIAGLTAQSFIWDSTTNLWYHIK